MERQGRIWTLAFAAMLSVALAAGVAVVLADPPSPVTITDVDSPDPVASGAQLTHTITIVNNGGAKIHDVVLSDQLNGVGGIGVPPQLQLASTRGTCQQSGDLVTCSAGTIEGNGVWVISIRGIVTAANGTVLNNTVSVTGTKSAQNFTTTNTVTTLVSNGGGADLADLSINKTGPSSVPVSTPMSYTLTVNNTGTQNATGITVIDTVPAPLTVTTATGTSLFTCDVDGQTVTCTGGAVNQGSNATITINASTPAAVPDPATITNTAVVDPNNEIPEINELNNTSALVNTLITAAPAPPPLGLNITDDGSVMTGAGPDPVIPGALETFKILATNDASTRADDVVIVLGTQSLEAASVMASQIVTDGAVGTFGGCTTTASEARCSVRSLDPGGTILMTVQGYVIGSAGSFIISTATVTGNIKNKGTSTTDTELTTVMPFIDLTITKDDAPDPVCASSFPGVTPPAPNNVCLGGLTYAIVVGNSGIGTATGVLVRDPLPAGSVFHDAVAPAFAGGCSVDTANVLTCTNGTIGPQSTTMITVRLVAPPGIGTIANTATVDPNNAIFEGDETNNTSTETTSVSTGVDLTVSKTDAIDPIATSGTQTYTITVDNIGPQDATNIRLRDTLPSGTIFRDVISNQGFTCGHSGGVVECVGGSLPGTKSEFYPTVPPGTGNVQATITIRIFAQSFVGTMHNEVRVDPLNEIPEVNEANNIATQDTTVGSGGAGMGAFNELTILKEQISPLPNPVARNAKVEYRITVGNDATDPVVNVRVRDFLPAGSTYIEATGNNNFLCTHGGGIVNCNGGTIPAGGTAIITVKIFAPDTPGSYTNQAIADPDNTIPEGNEFNNESSVQTDVAEGGTGPFNDLQIGKTATEDTTPGGTITYTLQITNAGSNPALNDVAVRDPLPTGVTFVSAADAGGNGAPFTCSHSGGVVNCTGATILGSPDPGRTITIVAKAPQQVVGAPGLLNVATVDPDNQIPEGAEFNNQSSDTTTVTPRINLTIKKDGPTTATQGEITDYVITIKNENPTANPTGQNAIGVTMHDPLPVGLIPLGYDAGTGNNWACQIQGSPINVVDCLGDLAAPGGEGGPSEVTITINVFITKEEGVLDNVACVDVENTITESNELDNCSDVGSFVTDPPKQSPDLLVTKSVDAASTTPGADLTYTVTISNVGTAKAKGWDAVTMTGLTITDDLPAQVTFTNATTTNGWSCTEAASVLTCHDDGSGMAVGASAQITILTSVSTSAAVPIVNSATAALGLVDTTDCTDPLTCENETAAHLANNTGTANTSIGSTGFDLALASITDVPDPVAPGQGLKYTVVAVNGGTATANGVVVRMTIPTIGVSYSGANGTNGFNCAAPVGNVVDCVGNLPGGGDTTLTLSFTTLLAIPPGDLTLTATIDPLNAFLETDEGNNADTEVTTVSGTTCMLCVDLVSTELTVTPEPITAGTATVTYQIVNVGDMPTTLDVLTQRLLRLIAATDGTLTAAVPVASDPTFTCTVDVALANLAEASCKGNLGPGAGVTISWSLSNLTTNAFAVEGRADPSDLVFEVSNANNVLVQTVIIF